MSPATPTGRTQALKDLKLTIEYKHLKQNAPGGVLVTPAFDDLRRWHGVIFVRKGFWQGGVFKFMVLLPRAYNDHGVFPEVTLQTSEDVGNPFLSPTDGRLDLKHAFPVWDPTSHFMVTVLTFLKKVFYLKDEDLEGYDMPANPAAAALFLADKEAFKAKAAGVAQRSQEPETNSGLYGNTSGSPIAFSPPAPEHDLLRQAILAAEDTHQGGRGGGGTVAVLELLAKLRREGAAAKTGKQLDSPSHAGEDHAVTDGPPPPPP
jgi:ubiquitin-protein ligase